MRLRRCKTVYKIDYITVIGDQVLYSAASRSDRIVPVNPTQPVEE